MAFRYSRYSGVTHQNVKIKGKFADFYTWILVDFFNAFDNIIKPPPYSFCGFLVLRGAHVHVQQRGSGRTILIVSTYIAGEPQRQRQRRLIRQMNYKRIQE